MSFQNFLHSMLCFISELVLKNVLKITSLFANKIIATDHLVVKIYCFQRSFPSAIVQLTSLLLWIYYQNDANRINTLILIWQKQEIIDRRSDLFLYASNQRETTEPSWHQLQALCMFTGQRICTGPSIYIVTLKVIPNTPTVLYC